MNAKSTPVRCVLYLRISLDRHGDGLATGRQREACERIARERGWVIVSEYVDSSISAYDKRAKRPGYDQMVKDYAAGEFDAIVCYDLDRLTRQPRQLEDWIDAAEGRGLKLVTANGEADLTVDSGRMFARIKGAVSRQESERKGARQVSAARQRAERGHMPVGVRAFGFTSGGDPLETPTWCEVATRQGVSEAEVAREMFARFHAGDSLIGIARWLNARGVPTRHGGAWSPNSVRQILVNPRYKGTVVYRHRSVEPGAPVPAAFPAIIDEAVWETVNERLADPRRKTAFGTDRRHLGSSLYLCGICQKPVRSHGSPSRYRCTEGHVNRTGGPVDAWVMKVIRARLAKPDLAGLLAAPASREARDATAEIRRLRSRLRKTDADYDADLIDAKRWKEKKAKIQAELDQAEARRARLNAGSEVAGVLTDADPVKKFTDAPLGIQRAVIAFFATVELLHVPRGRKGFDTASVRITPKPGNSPANNGG
jgi:site-specific DNA recombinase